jgi:hypothetical protein
MACQSNTGFVAASHFGAAKNGQADHTSRRAPADWRKPAFEQAAKAEQAEHAEAL